MKKVYVALENLRSLYNIGAIFRTCSFFGVDEVLLVGYSGKNTLPNGKVILHEEVKKSSLGSENGLNITFLSDSEGLINFAKRKNLKLVAVEQNKSAVTLDRFKPENDLVLVFGNEVDGVSPVILENSNQIIEIPRSGKHNSLNVTTTCGIVLYQLTA